MKTLLLSIAIALPATFASAASEAYLTPERLVEISAVMIEQGYEVAKVKIEED